MSEAPVFYVPKTVKADLDVGLLGSFTFTGDATSITLSGLHAVSKTSQINSKFTVSMVEKAQVECFDQNGMSLGKFTVTGTASGEVCFDIPESIADSVAKVDVTPLLPDIPYSPISSFLELWLIPLLNEEAALLSDGKFTVDDVTHNVPTSDAVDQFRYTLTDSDLDSSSATLTITATLPEKLDIGANLVVDETFIPGLGSEVDTDGDKGVADSDTSAAASFDIAANEFEALTIGGLRPAMARLKTSPSRKACRPFTEKYGELTLTVTKNDDGTYNVEYVYKVTSVVDHAPNAHGDDSAVDTDSFNFKVGGIDVGTIGVNIEDDAPVARAAVASAGPGVNSVFGNVIAGTVNGTEVDGQQDHWGVDGEGSFQWLDASGALDITFGTTELFYSGDADKEYALIDINDKEYGTLFLEDDGTYTYTKPAGSTLEGAIVVKYAIIDSDLDKAETTLTISVVDKGVTVTIPSVGDGVLKVYEANLEKGGEQLHDGTNADTQGDTTDPGQFTIDAPDGLWDLSIGCVPLYEDGVRTTNTEINDKYGTLVITEISGTPETGYTVKYEYTLEELAQHEPV